MSELLKQWFPHVMEKPDMFLTSLTETLIMVGWAGGFMFLFGLFFGIVLTVTKEGGVLACRPVYQVLDKIINLFRSIPFVILIALLMNDGNAHRREGSHCSFGGGICAVLCQTSGGGALRGG